jgi:nucleoside phosphorylase
MLGIAAGIRGKIELGQLIAADPTWDYGSGKRVEESGKSRFQPSPHQLPLDPVVRERVRAVAEDRHFLSEIRKGWPAKMPPGEVEIAIGPLASGAAVIADSATGLAVREQHRSLIGIDMEAYAVHVACEEASKPRPVPFALKAVVDFADDEKSDDVQDYGAYVSATVMARVARDLF